MSATIPSRRGPLAVVTTPAFDSDYKHVVVLPRGEVLWRIVAFSDGSVICVAIRQGGRSPLAEHAQGLRSVLHGAGWPVGGALNAATGEHGPEVWFDAKSPYRPYETLARVVGYIEALDMLVDWDL